MDYDNQAAKCVNPTSPTKSRVEVIKGAIKNNTENNVKLERILRTIEGNEALFEAIEFYFRGCY